MYERQIASDTVDVADVVRVLRRQWRAVVAFVVIGAVAAAALVLFGPRRFDGKVTVLARPGASNTGSIAGRMTGLGDLLGGIAGLTPGTFETELQLLRSRALASQVVDSLQLQFVVRAPGGVAPFDIVQHSELVPSFEPRRYTFERQAGGVYRVTGGDSTYAVPAGAPARIDIGWITLQPRAPARFALRVLDREDAITRFGRRFTATKAGGDVAKIVYRGDDSLSAAAAANAAVSFYLARRKTTDRGVNQRRVEYVTAQLESTGAELAQAERELRREQERTQVYDPEIFSEVELRSLAELRKSLTELQVEEASISQVVAQADAGRVTSRDLAAFPAFMRGSSVSPLAQQLSDLEAQRIRLLERRTERDPDVRALDETMKQVQSNIIAMARSYSASVSHQRIQMQTRLDSVQAKVLALPAAAEKGGRLHRDVLRLTSIFTALQAQLVDARLAAITEGGDIRQIDVAVPPRKPSFPEPWLTMGTGMAGGLLTGLVAALFLGWFGRWLRDPVEVERALGIAAQRYAPDIPLLVSVTPGARSVLVVPLRAGLSTTTVAERLVRTARQRALEAAILDLSDGRTAGNGKASVDSAQVSPIIDDMEKRHGSVVVQLPTLMSDVTIAALREDRPVVLVAPPGPVDRAQLAQAVGALRRMQVPCAGVVMNDPAEARPRALT